MALSKIEPSIVSTDYLVGGYMSEYMGWSSYATWRVNLEIFDGMSPGDFGDDDHKVSASECRQFVFDWLDNGACDNPIVHGWIVAFLSDVNWQEIAAHVNGE